MFKSRIKLILKIVKMRVLIDFEVKISGCKYL